VAECTNCRYERKYISRQARVDQMTPSQEKMVKAIREYFESKNDKPLARFETVLLQYGTVSVSVRTDDHPFLVTGGHFFVGRRGKLECLDAYDLWDDDHKKAKRHEWYIKNPWAWRK